MKSEIKSFENNSSSCEENKENILIKDEKDFVFYYNNFYKLCETKYFNTFPESFEKKLKENGLFSKEIYKYSGVKKGTVKTTKTPVCKFLELMGIAEKNVNEEIEKNTQSLTLKKLQNSKKDQNFFSALLVNNGQKFTFEKAKDAKDSDIKLRLLSANKLLEKYAYSKEKMAKIITFIELFSKNERKIKYSISFLDGNIIKNLIIFTDGLTEVKQITVQTQKDFEEKFKKKIEEQLTQKEDIIRSFSEVLDKETLEKNEEYIKEIELITPEKFKITEKSKEKKNTKGVCVEIYNYSDNTGVRYYSDSVSLYDFCVADRKKQESHESFTKKYGLEYHDCRNHGKYDDINLKFEECEAKISGFANAIKEAEEGKKKSIENLEKLITNGNFKKKTEKNSVDEEDVVTNIKNIVKKLKEKNEEIKMLKKKIEEQNSDISKLKEENKNRESLKCELDEEKRKNHDLLERHNSLLKKLSKKDEKIKEFNDEKSKQDLKIRELQEENKKLEEENTKSSIKLESNKKNEDRIKDFTNKNKELIEKSIVLKKKLNEQNSGILKLKEENKKLQEENDRIKEENTKNVELSRKKEEELNEIKKKYESIKNELERMNKEIKKLNEQNSGILKLKEENKKLQEENDRIKEENNKNVELSRKKEEELNEIKKKYESIKNELEEKTKVADSIENKSREKMYEIENLKEKLNKLKEENDRIKEENTKNVKLSRKKEEELFLTTVKNESIKDELERMNKEIKKLKEQNSDISKLKEENKKLQEENDKSSIKNNFKIFNLEKDNKDLKEEIDKSNIKFESYKKDIKRKFEDNENKNKELWNNLKEREEKIKNFKAELSKRNSSIFKLQDENKDLQENLNKHFIEINKLLNENEKLQRKNEEREQAINNLNEEIINLVEKITSLETLLEGKGKKKKKK